MGSIEEMEADVGLGEQRSGALGRRLAWRALASSMQAAWVLALLIEPSAIGQETGKAPQQAAPDATTLRRPGDVYREAMHPLDVVRNSLDNWSDSELGALAAGMHQARKACAQAKPEQYAGEDLYDLARLCALGQDWNSVLTVARRSNDSWRLR